MVSKFKYLNSRRWSPSCGVLLLKKWVKQRQCAMVAWEWGSEWGSEWLPLNWSVPFKSTINWTGYVVPVADEWSNRMEHCWNYTVRGNRRTWKIPYSTVSFFTTQPRVWVRKRTSTVTAQRLTAWTMAWPDWFQASASTGQRQTAWGMTQSDWLQKFFLTSGYTFHWADISALQNFEDIYSIKFV